MNAVVEALLRSSLQGALFIAAVWLVCRLFPRLPAAVRCGLWWAASLKLLVGLVWISPVELPVLPASDSTSTFTRAVSSAAGALTSPALLSRPPSHPPGEEGEQQGKTSSLSPLSPGGRGGGRERGGWGSEGPRRPSSIDFSKAAVVGFLFLWLAGLTLHSAKAIRQLRYTRWVIARSRPLREGWIRAAFAELCALLALRRPPELRGSEEVRTPQALGPLRPLVLLPESGLARLSPTEVSMTLCHELIHLRRGDLWLGWVPALAHRIFFFHPLAALAVREYAIAREAACDAEVLRLLGSAPQAYGRLLLRWGVAPRETGLAAAGASPSLENLKRRLQMLQQTSERKRRLSGWWWLAGAAVMMVGLIPFRIVAQEPAPQAQAEAAPEVAEAPAPPAEVAAEPVEAPAAVAEGIPGGVEGGVAGGVEGGIPGGVEGGIPGGVQGGVKGGVAGGVAGALAPKPVLTPKAVLAPAPAAAMAPAVIAVPSAGPTPGVPALAPAAPPRPGVAPVAAVAWAPLPAGTPRAQSVPAPPAPPAPPVPPAPPKKHGYSYSWHQGDHGDSWVLMYGNDSSTMSGSWSDLEKAKRLRGNSKEDILWFRHDGKEYVVRDAGVLKQAEEIFRPQMELGAKQGELGARQGALGGKQGALGAKQGALGAKQGALGAQMATLAAEQAASDKDDGDLEKRQHDLEKQMDDLGRQQEELGRQQEELGRQQEALGRQQEELGRQQEAASAKAEKEFHALMEQAVRSGAAQEVK